MATESPKFTDQQVEDARALAQQVQGRPIEVHDLEWFESHVAHRSGRKTKAEQWAATLERFNEIKDRNPAWKADSKALRDFAVYNHNRAMGLSTREISPAPGTIFSPPTLSTLSVQYANEDYIGEQICPVATVSRRVGNYPIYGINDRMQYPDDQFGDRGFAPELNETRTMGVYTVQDRGFSNRVSQEVLANQDAPLDEMFDVAQSIADGLLYRRELRIATLLTTPANYGVNTNVIVAANRWNSVGGGNPLLDLQTADAGVFPGHGPGKKIAVTSLTTYNVLARHPMILMLSLFKDAGAGLATPDMLAAYFRWDRLLVGRARGNTAQEGAAAAWGRLWEPAGVFSFGIVRVPVSTTIRNTGFATTFRMGNPITTVSFNEQDGHGGSFRAQMSVAEVQQVTAQMSGWLIQTPI